MIKSSTVILQAYICSVTLKHDQGHINVVLSVVDVKKSKLIQIIISTISLTIIYS